MQALNFLRILGALGIFIYHMPLKVGPVLPGSACVTFFFVLSGFVSAYSFNKKDFSLSKHSFFGYFIRKICKFAPLYYVSLLFGVVSAIIKHTFSLKPFLLDLFMVQTFAPIGDDIWAFNGVAWFMANLFLFYFISPFMFAFLKRTKVANNVVFKLLLAGICLTSIFLLSYLVGENSNYGNKYWLLYLSPISRLSNYLVGFLLGDILYDSLIFKNYTKSTKLQEVELLVFSLFEITILVIFVGLIFVPSAPFLNEYTELNAFFILPSCALIVCFAYGKGVLSKLFSLDLFRHLGDATFVVYMTQFGFLPMYEAITKMPIATAFDNIWVELIYGVFVYLFYLMIACIFNKLVLQHLYHWLYSLITRKHHEYSNHKHK